MYYCWREECVSMYMRVSRSSHLRGTSRYVTEPHKGLVQPLHRFKWVVQPPSSTGFLSTEKLNRTLGHINRLPPEKNSVEVCSGHVEPHTSPIVEQRQNRCFGVRVLSFSASTELICGSLLIVRRFLKPNNSKN